MRRFCDYWLPSRRKCYSGGTIKAEDQYGKAFAFCRRHWERQDHIAAQYGALHEVAEFGEAPR